MCPKRCPHRYCRPAVPPRSVPRHRRVRPRGRGLSLLLAAVAVTGSGCALTNHPNRPGTPRVLGEPKGTTLVVGQPAPGGTGEFDAVSCATARRCWAVGVAGPECGRVGDRDHRDRGHHQWRRVLEGSARGRREHATAQRSLVPHCDQLHGGRVNGGSLPGSGVVVTTTDAGRTWAPAKSPTNALAVTSVVCTSTSSCTAIVSDGTLTWSAHSFDFGASWQQEGGLPTLFLPANEFHVHRRRLVPRRRVRPHRQQPREGAVALSTDGGNTWALAAVPAGVGLLQSAACLTALECVATGTTSTTSATSSRPRVRYCSVPTAATRGNSRLSRFPSTTSSASPAPRPHTARWSEPNGTALRLSPPGRSPRASTVA